MTVDVMSSAYVAATLSKEAIEQSSVSFTSQSPKGGATAVLETKNCTAAVTVGGDYFFLVVSGAFVGVVAWVPVVCASCGR